ncbi:MAG: peptide chain release factor-like protein [Pseudomonadota bacterium]
MAPFSRGFANHFITLSLLVTIHAKLQPMPITPKKENALRLRMNALGIKESDLQEKFVRSAGPGGQRKNKVSTCVMLTHSPSGIQVKCQKTRIQALNRYYARTILIEKLEQKILGKKSALEQKRWKIRKQKQRRSRKAKVKMLEEKRRQSEKKQLRRKVGFE